MNQELDYAALKEILCIDRTKQGSEMRKKMFDTIDKNKNGFLSFSEVYEGLRNLIPIKDLSRFKDVVMRSFQAAKDSVHNKKKLSPENIERNEFRYFLCYLRQYFEYYEMFSIVNTDGDKYLNINEFKNAIPQFEKWGIKITNPEKTFNEIDLDKGGFIRFDEFCHWAIKTHLDIETDDDFDDPCLQNMK
jgi:Ca2+-binding EF-hand superfamily protein